jgi:hypothetical protein
MRIRLARDLVALLAGATVSASAQTIGAATPVGSAAWVVDMFYARPSFPEKHKYLTGEFAENYSAAATMGSRLPRTVTVTSRALLSEAGRAVYATFIRDAQHAQDWYTYLRKEEGVWKIEAVRTLSLPPIQYAMLDSLEGRRARGLLPDSLVPVTETMRLSTRSDSGLKAYVVANEPALRVLARRFAAMRGLDALSVSGEVFPAGATGEVERRSLASGLRALRLGAALRFSDQPNCVFLKIGGVTDNQVGFIYAPAGCVPPGLSPDEYIYVERVVPGWFVYKTT